MRIRRATQHGQHRWSGRVTIPALGSLGVLLTITAGASGATVHVDARTGSDRNNGREKKPVRTITRAAALARRGDEVSVRSGRYPEMVRLTRKSNGVVFRAAPGAHPIVDGERKLPYGFNARHTSNVRISGFEVRGQTVSGVQIQGTRNIVRDMNIHDVGINGQNASQGIAIIRGAHNRVEGNRIHAIGPGFESRGIWLLQTRQAKVTRNVIYLVRKDGIRDWQSLDDRLTSNRIFLNHNGISFNQTTGAYAANNHLAYNQVGFVAKHVSSPPVLNYWSLPRGRLSRFWHNTIEHSNETGLWIGNSEEPLDHLNVANNVIRGGGYTFVRDVPSLRGPNVSVDGNMYVRLGSQPSAIYKAEWGREPPPLTSWSQYQKLVGWDSHGWLTNAGVRRRPEDGVNLHDRYKRQLGAQDVPGPAQGWQPITMTPIDSSSSGTWFTEKHLRDVVDGNSATYWLTGTAANEFITFDLHGRQTLDTLIATVHGHFDERNVHGYRFEVSDDRKKWRTIAKGANPDMAGSSLKYKLEKPVRARYLRYTMVDTSCISYAPRTSCGEYFVVPDIAAGLLSPGKRRRPKASSRT
jgi:hypothetical protein